MIPEGAIISGFISKIINDITDVSIEKLQKADKDRKFKNQSFETRIYQVIIDALNEWTNSNYMYQEQLYDAAEHMLNGFKNTEKDKMDVVKSGLNILISNIDDTKCEKFIKILCHEISKEINFDIYKEILLILLNQKNDCNRDELQQIRNKLDEVILKLDKKTVYDEKNIAAQNIKFQNNKKEDYLKNWNSRLFLHIDNEERPITLADAFIMPDYKKYKEIKRIGFSFNDTLDKIIEKFIKYNKTSTMLLMGVPGIGKSSITSWIASKYKDSDDIIILRFRDWKVKELEKGLLDAICHILCCESEELEDKILVLDGFDEMKLVNSNHSLVNDFFNEILDYNNLKIIITSRLNYIEISEFQNVFQIKSFHEDKMEQFFERITGNKLDSQNIDKNNLDVLGIPVILYMAIVANIDLTMKASKPELYHRIFAENGGILDKFPIKGVAYDNGSHPFKDKANKKIYLEFLQEIAFKMFEKNDLSLEEKEYQIPEIKFQKHQMRVLEFPMKYLFEDSNTNIEFIHQSIYEYFVSEYIFTAINHTVNDDEPVQNLANVLGCILKSNDLSPEILEFLNYKIKYYGHGIPYNIINEAFQRMLQDGMTYYIEERCKNVLKCEIKIFKNMLEILHCWEERILGFNILSDYIRNINASNLNLREAYLKGINLIGANLREANLRGADLREANLREADLREAYLIGANLRGANLREVDLGEADLKRVYLRGADLREANLRGADLREANLREADLREANLERANLREADLREADLRGAYLRKVDLREADLRGAYLRYVNLESVDLDASIWHKNDIQKVLPQLRTANFTYIIVEGERKKVYKEELFSEEFSLNDFFQIEY